MERFEIEFSKQAAKDYKKLPKNYKSLIDLTLDKLLNRLPIDIKPVKGEKNVFRVRVGKYRVLFIKIKNILLITKIETRGDAYK